MDESSTDKCFVFCPNIVAFVIRCLQTRKFTRVSRRVRVTIQEIGGIRVRLISLISMSSRYLSARSVSCRVDSQTDY